MSSRSKKIVELALQMEEHTDDESDSDPFSAVDSDLDPMFLPSSNDELSDSSDISLTEIIGQKKKFTKTTGKDQNKYTILRINRAVQNHFQWPNFKKLGYKMKTGHRISMFHRLKLETILKTC
ncbi:unnamed protein product [Acanthoscelides obtectus]|uniref:Uncharacterized protein n=1 Tax=Acanthoscelides obtectus TaxID=200917 RepID=A0A9P0QCA9_ACAOB|nr:unnamed protein product [Acanthoscelides obtectus]CAK1685863.1 hypothetical protein AOBTE_LOCUS35677 [Acanthoscelides obtectus]